MFVCIWCTCFLTKNVFIFAVLCTLSRVNNYSNITFNLRVQLIIPISPIRTLLLVCVRMFVGISHFVVI